MSGSKLEEESAVPEILGIGVGISEIVVDQYRGLPGQLETFAALVASNQIIESHHVGSRFGELPPIFFTGATRQFPFLAGDFPAHGEFKFAAAARANELDLPRFFFFRVKHALVHS